VKITRLTVKIGSQTIEKLNVVDGDPRLAKLREMATCVSADLTIELPWTSEAAMLSGEFFFGPDEISNSELCVKQIVNLNKSVRDLNWSDLESQTLAQQNILFVWQLCERTKDEVLVWSTYLPYLFELSLARLELSLGMKEQLDRVRSYLTLPWTT